MAGKIFINYRRDDVPGEARGVRDAVAAKLGQANVFMNVGASHFAGRDTRQSGT